MIEQSGKKIEQEDSSDDGLYLDDCSHQATLLPLRHVKNWHASCLRDELCSSCPLSDLLAMRRRTNILPHIGDVLRPPHATPRKSVFAVVIELVQLRLEHLEVFHLRRLRPCARSVGKDLLVLKKVRAKLAVWVAHDHSGCLKHRTMNYDGLLERSQRAPFATRTLVRLHGTHEPRRALHAPESCKSDCSRLEVSETFARIIVREP